MDEQNETTSKVEFQEEIIRTVPEDGFVPERIPRPAASPRKITASYHKGYRSSRVYTTSDPRVTRPFVYGICALFFLIGVCLLFSDRLLFGIVFLTASVLTFVRSKKQIDETAEKMAAEGKDVTIDSKEELRDIAADVAQTFHSGYREAAKETFQKEHLQRMKKLSLIIFLGVGIFAFILLSVLVNVLFGLAALLVIVFAAVLYCGLLTFLEKKYHD